MIARTLLLVAFLFVAACGPSTRYTRDADTHVVRRGETLFSIAERYNLTTAQLVRWNRIGDGSLIYPGQVIRLSPPPGSAARSSSPTRRSLPEIPDQPAPGFAWPTAGRINVEFGGTPGPGTGVLIDGKRGQAVIAAASGTVVYAGSGLIGYGQLIILKHNDTYLSTYGYNATLLVREGQNVRQGQRIATMGEGPEHKPRLHFEIRRNGNPVNPRQFLPPR